MARGRKPAQKKPEETGNTLSTAGGNRKKRKYTVSEKAIAQRQKNAGSPACKSPEEIAYNARLIEYALQVQNISAATDKRDPVSVRSAFANYLQLCQQYGFKVSNLSACAAIGINYLTLENWLKADNRPEFQQIARTIKTVCSLSREQLISDGKINPVIGIFWQRNFDGLRNDTEQKQDMLESESESDIATATEYRKKYAGMLSE